MRDLLIKVLLKKGTKEQVEEFLKKHPDVEQSYLEAMQAAVDQITKPEKTD